MLDYIAAPVTMTGIYLMARKRRVAWLFSIAGAVLWLGFGFEIGSVATVAMDAVVISLGIRGWRLWK